MKILYVDFCGTLTTTSTLNKFCKYVFKKHSIYTKFYYLYILLSDYINTAQPNIIKPFNNMHISTLDRYAKSFFDNQLESHINEKTINYIKKAISDDYHVVIISGGLRNYIEHISKVVKVDSIIAKEFLVSHNIIKPIFISGSVFQNEKVFKVHEYEKKLDSIIDERVVLSDSEDDMPLFLLADKRILVNSSSKRLTDYAKNNNWDIL